jgi:hypothetical protein
MIATQYGSNIRTQSDDGKVIGDFYISSSATLLGYSDGFLVLRSGGQVYTLDEKGQPLGYIMVPEEYQITRITRSGFSVKKGALLESFTPACQPNGFTYV